MALWFWRSVGTYPQTIPEAAPVSSPFPASSEPPSAAAAGGEQGDASPAAKDRSGDSIPAGVNGTNLYLKASALLKQLSESERKMIKQPREEVSEAEAKALFEKLKPILALIHEAVGADYYDWGLGKLSYDTTLPQYRIIMELAQAALWSAAYRFAEDPAGALEDLAARAQIPRSETHKVLIGGLIASSMEKSALEVIRENAVYLNASTLARARTLLAESTFDQDARGSFAGEAAFSDSISSKITAMSPDERLKWVRSSVDAALQPAVEKIFLDPERLADEIRFIKSFNAKMAEAVTWTDAQFEAWSSQFTAGLGDYPFAAMLLTSVYGVRDAIRQVQVEREMLGAGLAILSEGPAAAALARDPGTGKPFSYMTTSAGFELRSPTLDKNGRPIFMRFTSPK